MKMKLPRLRRQPAPEPAERATASPAAPALQVLIYSNTGLSEQEFSVQTEKLRRVASYDGADFASPQARVSVFALA